MHTFPVVLNSQWMKEKKEMKETSAMSGASAGYPFTPSEVAINKAFAKVESAIDGWLTAVGWPMPKEVTFFSKYGEAVD